MESQRQRGGQMEDNLAIYACAAIVVAVCVGFLCAGLTAVLFPALWNQPDLEKCLCYCLLHGAVLWIRFFPLLRDVLGGDALWWYAAVLCIVVFPVVLTVFAFGTVLRAGAMEHVRRDDGRGLRSKQ